MLDKVAAALMKRGFEAVAVSSREEALRLVLDEAENAQSVGWGGSETVS